MRTYTVLLSVLVHAFAVATAVVVPIVANDELPEPRRATAFVLVTPVVPVPPPSLAPATRPRLAAANAAPVEEPDAVQPELPPEPPVDFLAMPSDAVVSGGSLLDAGSLPAVTPPPPPALRPPDPVRVGGAIRPPERILQVAPEYPAIARASRTTGVVILEAVIAEDGSVRDVRVLRSVPLLDAAAMDAVRKWRFTPTLLNGVPVPIVMTVTVSFTLN
jgi:periplasmic protein TonB